jgi:hypothetical protein
MEGPTDTEEASIPTEPERMIRTLKRKAAKRTWFTLLTGANIKSSPDEDTPAKKKSRLQCWIPVGFNFEASQIPDKASLPAIEPEADTLNDSSDASVAVASPDAGGCTDPVADIPTQPINVGAARAPSRFWTPEEDMKLTSAVKATGKKWYGKENKTDWFAVAVLVPGRTYRQCCNRWHNTLHSNIDETVRRAGKWTTEEDSTLKDAVKKYNGENWVAISKLVPGRTYRQCVDRWHNSLHSMSDETSARTGRWTKIEDAKLKDAVEKHNGKDWAAISEFVPGRKKQQCWSRWHEVLLPKSDETTARKGEWTKEEDIMLKEAVDKHNGEDWAAISELVPGRTKTQCNKKWQYARHSMSDETTTRVVKSTTDEDSTLKDAAEKCSGKNWAAISSLVLGLTKRQCSETDVTAARKGKWTADEDVKLKDAADVDTLNASPDASVAVASPDAAGGTFPVVASPAQPNAEAATARLRFWAPEEDAKLTSAVKTTCMRKYGEEYRMDWGAVTALVPGRTKQQSKSRWHVALESTSDETTVRMGRWTTEEDFALKDAVEKHNGEDWAISELVPGRTNKQCWNRWNDDLHPKSDDTARKGDWTTEEDDKLVDAVEKYNGMNWQETAALVPGRTKKQCQNRWKRVVESKKNETTARKGEWTTDEDNTLKDAVEKCNGKDWAAISELVPGRTKQQCYHRWYNSRYSKSDETTARMGTWTTEEDITLKDAVQKHNGKDWTAISALVPGRKEKQCWDRWVKWLHQSCITTTENDNGVTN